MVLPVSVWRIYFIQRHRFDQRNLKSAAWESAGSRICQSYYRENPVLSGCDRVHDLMIHDYGPGNLFATVHVEFPAETPVIEAA